MRFELPAGLTPGEARALQETWREHVRLSADLNPARIRYLGGADLSMQWHGHDGWATIVVLDMRTGETVDIARAEGRLDFPYVPGLLAFREAPLLAEAWSRLSRPPEVLLCDGQGYAHPRGMGLACMAGLVLGVPTVGCAKSRLCGEAGEPGRERGRFRWLTLEGNRIGMVLRTRDGVRPLYVSPGHRMDFFGARRLTLFATPQCRIPEPIRRAHTEVNAMRRSRT